MVAAKPAKPFLVGVLLGFFAEPHVAALSP